MTYLDPFKRKQMAIMRLVVLMDLPIESEAPRASSREGEQSLENGDGNTNGKNSSNAYNLDKQLSLTFYELMWHMKDRRARPVGSKLDERPSATTKFFQSAHPCQMI
jgi:hypothetical protein